MTRFKNIKVHFKAEVEKAIEGITAMNDIFGNVLYKYESLESKNYKELVKQLRQNIEQEYATRNKHDKK